MVPGWARLTAAWMEWPGGTTMTGPCELPAGAATDADAKAAENIDRLMTTVVAHTLMMNLRIKSP